MANPQLKEFLKDILLSDAQYEEVYRVFCQQISLGLGKRTNPQADIKCWITYVQDLPTGNETGKFLALDMGGTNFRVLLVTLKGEGNDTMDNEIFPIPQEIMVGTGEKLFDHIADCLMKFMEKYNLRNEKLALGFTFSFPCVQLGLEKAKLVIWTKGFQASGVEGEDVGRLLREAIERRGGADIEITAVLNDTVGTLMSCAHRNPNCRVGVIIGTGCNACYVEQVGNAELLEPEYKNKPNIIINCEWGAFGDSGILEFVRTKYDRIIDEKSLNRGHQFFEKMMAGMYLGNLVRLILIDAIQNDLIFTATSDKSALIGLLTNNEHVVQTSHLSQIEADDPRDMTFTSEFIRDTLKVSNVSKEDCEKLRFISEAVSRRAANFAGIGLSGLTNRVNRPTVVIGVDGSVYRLHTKFRIYMREIMNKYVDRKIQYEMMLSDDGSGRGAALVAAVASRKSGKCPGPAVKGPPKASGPSGPSGAKKGAAASAEEYDCCQCRD